MSNNENEKKDNENIKKVLNNPGKKNYSCYSVEFYIIKKI